MRDPAEVPSTRDEGEERAPGLSRGTRRALLFSVGAIGFLIAVLSVVDMFLPKAFDGVVPEPYSTGGIQVVQVVTGGPADRAGIRPGDTILGIGRRLLNKAVDAPPELRRHRPGETVPYLVKRDGRLLELPVTLTPYRLGSVSYFYYAFLGGIFFVLGVFVVSRRPEDAAGQVFYILCILFMLFLVCSLRPTSYYWVDYFVQIAGTIALLLLPALFLHFFLLFPTRKTFHFADRAPGEPPASGALALFQRFLNGSPALYLLLYTFPPFLYLVHMSALARGGGLSGVVFGAPRLNWILLADYLVLGLLALGHSWWTNQDRSARRPILVLLLGTLAGTIPFVVFAVYFPALVQNEQFMTWGVAPMAIVPLTFAYAIVRFRLFDVSVIISKSIVYGVLTAVVTAFYALAISAGNAIAAIYTGRDSHPLLGVVIGLTVVLFFDPLRQRMQRIVDKLFFRDRADFQAAVLEMSRQAVSQLERGKIHEILTRRTAELLRLDRLDLLTPRPEDGALTSGRPSPAMAMSGASEGLDGTGSGRSGVVLPKLCVLSRVLAERNDPVRLADLDTWTLDEPSRHFREEQLRRGTRVLIPLASRGKLLGVLAAGRKRSEEEFTREDLDHLTTIANQGALGLEAAGLHEELTRRAEMARDLDIARDIQLSLFPRELPKMPGIQLFALCRPARVVGGDFYDFLDVGGTRQALVLGDVSGKSIPASLLMVAAKEIVYANAMNDPEPAAVFRESNRRIYDIKRRMFVSLAYVLVDHKALSLTWSIGGQPTPLLVRAGSNEAIELPSPETRLPLGALRDVTYDEKTFYLRKGDLLLFYTDGLNEAMSETMSPYGDERLKASLVRHSGRPLPELAEELLEDVRQFTYGAEQYDDQTFVLMRVG